MSSQVPAPLRRFVLSPAALRVVVAAALVTACGGKDDFDAPSTPDAYAPSEQVTLVGVPVGRDEACGGGDLTHRAAVASLPNRLRAPQTFAPKRPEAGVATSATVELQLDLTEATCKAGTDGGRFGGVAPDEIRMRGILVMRTEDGRFDLRIRTSLACTLSSTNAVRCSVLGSALGSAHRGTFPAPATRTDASTFSVYGNVGESLELDWSSGVDGGDLATNFVQLGSFVPR